MSSIPIGLPDGNAIWETLLSLYAQTTDAQGQSPLWRATLEGDYDKVKYLIASGANVDGRVNARLKVSSTAVGKQITVLDPSANATEHYKQFGFNARVTPLWTAATLGYHNIVKLLLNSGADVNFKIDTGFSALFIASYNGHTKVVEFLIEGGVEVDSEVLKGNTALLIALENGQREVAELLISVGADVTAKDIDGYSALHYASRNGFVDLAEFLINDVADIDERNIIGRSGLFLAASEGHNQIVELLIKAGADIDTTDSRGASVLFATSLEGHTQVVELLVKAGADIDAKNDENQSPLHGASYAGSQEVVKLLIIAGAHINAKDNAEITPLFAASHEGQKEVVDVLITAGADLESKDCNGVSALNTASRHGYWKVVELLINAGADITTKTSDSYAALHLASYNGHEQVVELLTNAGADLECRDSRACSALHLASFNGHTKVVDSLIKAGAHIEAKNSNDMTPLFAASYNGHTEVVKLLINANADVEVTDDNGESALCTASYHGHKRAVELLLDAGACADAKDLHRRSAMYAASHNGHTDVVDLLIQAGADIDAKNEEGMSPLCTASNNGHNEVVRRLINAGANIESRSSIGNCSLIHASQNGHTPVVESLINAGADVNAKDCKNRSALFIASWQGHAEVVKVLIRAGTDIDAKDIKGRSAMWIASGFGYKDSVELLIIAGADVETKSNIGASAVRVASISGHKDVVELLVRAGAVKDTDHDLHDLSYAVASGHKPTIEFLINAAITSGRPIEFNIIEELLTEAITHRKPDVIQQISKHFQTFGPEELSLSEFLSLCRLPAFAAKLTGCINTCRAIMMMAARYNALVGNIGDLLPFRSVIDYNIFDQARYNQRDFVTDVMQLPTSVDQNVPKIDQLIQSPGYGKVECIPGKIAKTIFQHTEHVVEEIIEQFNSLDIIQVRIGRCGSAAEGTNVSLPDEMDFILSPRLDIDEVEIFDREDGYKICTRNSVHKHLLSKAGETLDYFCRGSKHFHDEFWAYLLESGVTDHEMVATPIGMVKDGGQASTEMSVKWLDPETNNYFLVSVDLVPVLHFANAWPENAINRTWMMDNETLKSRGFALVAKPPHIKSELGRSIKEEDRIRLWRLSCSHLETEHIANIDSRVKDAYIAAKCLRNPDVCRILIKDGNGILHNVDKYVTSYLLKTVFLHNAEDFIGSNKSLIEMVYIIYCDLEDYLDVGFLPLFWQQDANTLGGLSIDIDESLQVTRWMKAFVRRLYLRMEDTDGMDSDDEDEVVVYSRAGTSPPVSYYAFSLDENCRVGEI